MEEASGEKVVYLDTFIEGYLDTSIGAWLFNHCHQPLSMNNHCHQQAIPSPTAGTIHAKKSQIDEKKTAFSDELIIEKRKRQQKKWYSGTSFFSIPFISLALLSRSLPAVTQIRGHIAGPRPPSPRRYAPSFLSREVFSILFPRRLASNCAYPRCY